MRKFLGLAISFLVAMNAAASPSVEDLSWMTGVWSGPIYEGVLQEHWTEPEAGSIQALVRQTSGGKTVMVELIVIEESEDGLDLWIQQWDAGFKPRTAEAEHMKMDKLGENEVRFVASGDGNLASLTYRRPTETRFEIHVETAQQQSFVLVLTSSKVSESSAEKED